MTLEGKSAQLSASVGFKLVVKNPCVVPAYNRILLSPTSIAKTYKTADPAFSIDMTSGYSITKPSLCGEIAYSVKYGQNSAFTVNLSQGVLLVYSDDNTLGGKDKTIVIGS